MGVSWPSIWPLVRSWLTPAVLFVLLNLVIGTIVLTSKSLLSHRHPDDPAGNGRAIARTASSALQRLRSISLCRLHSGGFFFESPPAATAVHHESDETVDPLPDPNVSESEDEHMFRRSQSETRPLAAEAAEAASVSLTKSASERSATGPFEEKKAAKRPAKAKAVMEEEVEHEVDARADDFINRFRQQLHLQRLDSLLRYKEMLSRGK